MDVGKRHSGVADNGWRPPVYLTGMQKLCASWGIRHTISSPNHHEANGTAEAAVKAIKAILGKTTGMGALMSTLSAPASWS